MTEESTGLAKLAEALAKAQGAMKPAARDHENPFFHSKYADLASVWESIRKPLSDNGLAVTQAVTTTETGSLAIETRLLHSSGEHVGSLLVVPTGKGDIQALGSAISYGRRYALSALLGVVSDEEDDGNAASGKGEQKKAEQKPIAKPVTITSAPVPVTHTESQPAPKAAPLGADITPLNDWYIKPESRSAFWAAAKAAGHKTQEETLAIMGVTSMRLWTGTLEEAINKLRKPELPPMGVEQEELL